MARVTLISPYNRRHIGIRYLSSSLRNKGHQVSVIYFKELRIQFKKRVKSQDESYHMMVNQRGDDIILSYNSPVTPEENELLISLLNQLKPNLIGITLTTLVLKTAIFLTQKIKSNFKVPVIWGGIEPTIEPEKCIQFADIICIGEGEAAIVELADAIDKEEDFSSLKNLWVKKNGTIIKNPIRPLEQNLDTLPLRVECENEYFIEGNKLIKLKDNRVFGGVYETTTSRGCPFSCSFCCNSILRRLYNGQPFLRRRSVENVIQELKIAKQRLGINYIFFHDDVFTLNSKWISQFAELYRKEIAIPFWCYAHPTLINHEILIALKNAGVDRMTVGIQSGSPYISREIYKRKVSNESIIKCSKLLHELKIKHDFDIITNNPVERKEDCEATLDLLLSFPIPPTLNAGLSKLSVFPGYEIEKIVRERKNELSEPIRSFYNKLYLLTQYNIPRRWIKRWSKSLLLQKFQWILKGLLIFYLWYPNFVVCTKVFIKHSVPGIEEVWNYLKRLKERRYKHK